MNRLFAVSVLGFLRGTACIQHVGLEAEDDLVATTAGKEIFRMNHPQAEIQDVAAVQVSGVEEAERFFADLNVDIHRQGFKLRKLEHGGSA